MFSPYVAYIRVSTETQVQKGISLEAQQHLCLGWIEKDVLAQYSDQTIQLTWAVYDGNENLYDGVERPHPKTPGKNDIHVLIYRDAGISGSTPLDSCPGLSAALGKLPRNGVFVVAKLDRIDREQWKAASIDKIIETRKARLISVAGEGTEGNEPHHTLVRGILKEIRAYERKLISERNKSAATERKRQDLCTGQIPTGFCLSPDGRHVEKRTVPEWAVVEAILDLWADGRPYRAIVDDLRARSGGYRAKNGRFLTLGQIQRIIVREILAAREAKEKGQ